MNVFETLSRAAGQWRRRTALSDGAGALDFQSLWREVESVRLQLDRLGVKDGQGIGVLARNGRGLIVGVLAALGCGAVVMPLYHLLKPAEIADLLARAPLAAILDDGSGPTPDGHFRCQLQGPFGAMLRFTRLSEHAHGPLVPWVEGAAFVRFTSGTTGEAKGVVLTHDAVLERIRAANAGLGLGPEDTVLWVLPMAFHFFVSILLYLEVGATIVVSPNHLAESILDFALKHHATFLYATPMHVQLLAAEPSRRPLPPTLRRVLSVSSSLAPQVARRFFSRFGLPVAQAYGIIEAGLPIMNLEEAREHPEAIGRPVPAFEAAILDGALTPVANGATGQLALRGPGLFAGYISPPLPREAVLQDGWFLTGDLAHRDPAGRFVIDGRCKFAINVAGHKVFPEEVAAILELHPAVLRSHVTARPHAQLGESVHADVQLRAEPPLLTAEALLAHCRVHLSSYKVPASITFVTEIELTASGKVRHG